MQTATNNPDFDMEAMKIKYGGGNEIDANTLINSLLHFTIVVQEVNKGLSKEKKVEIKIKANTPGSFIVDLIVESSNIIEGVKQIFTGEHVAYAAGLLYVVGEVYKVAKHLGGKKPRNITSNKDTTSIIENSEGQSITFDFRGANIYLNNPIIKNAISQEFETLESDTKVKDFEFLDNEDKPIIEIKRDEFYRLSTSGKEDEEDKNEQVEIVRGNLNIASLDLEFKKKWDFYYLGNKISAKVKDSAFSERVDKGERFAKGDTLEAKMEIKTEFDEDVNAFVNKSYVVIEILKHTERPPQGNLDFPKHIK